MVVDTMKLMCDLTEKETRLKIAVDLLDQKEKKSLFVNDEVIRTVLGGEQNEVKKADS